MIASQLSGTCMNITVKILNELDPPIPTFEIIFIRMSITYFFSILYMQRASVPYPVTGPPGVRYFLAIRGVTGFFGLFGIYYSLIYLSLSDAIVITFLMPTTIAIVGYFVLRESLSRREMIAGTLSFLGVVLIARPPFLFGEQSAPHVSSDDPNALPTQKGSSTQRLIAVGVSLLGVLGGTGAFISIRAIGKRAHALHSVSFFSLYSCIVSVMGMILLRIPIVLPTSLAFAGLMISVGIFGLIAQVLLTMGLQREAAGRASLGLYIQILFAAAAERVIFHSVPPATSLAGIIIILSCAAYVAITKKTGENEKGDDIRHLGSMTGSMTELERRDSLDEDAAEETDGFVSGISKRASDVEQNLGR
ncbi:hypothetical protein FS842_004519 [Serendipita sp. 407]|nr:hypothetical protein FRC15_001259 [Serendipita sp. 397]KAG9029851.1 hypothetical protein FS842_004519 [Serendipita sp. 407]